VRDDSIAWRFAARLGELATWLGEAEGRFMVDSPRRMNDSATGFNGIFRASAHAAAPSRDEGGREDSFDRGDSREGPPGSGSDVASRSCCFVESDDIVESSMSGLDECSSNRCILPDDISGMIGWPLTVPQTCLELIKVA
jgi:hypothetical protein